MTIRVGELVMYDAHEHCFPLALGSALLASSHMLQVLPQAEALLYKHVHSCTCRRISENPGSSLSGFRKQMVYGFISCLKP